jgi:hypothetical protein
MHVEYMELHAQQPHAPDRRSAGGVRACRANVAHLRASLGSHLPLAAGDAGRLTLSKPKSSDSSPSETAFRIEVPTCGIRLLSIHPSFLKNYNLFWDKIRSSMYLILYSYNLYLEKKDDSHTLSNPLRRINDEKDIRGNCLILY